MIESPNTSGRKGDSVLFRPQQLSAEAEKVRSPLFCPPTDARAFCAANEIKLQVRAKALVRDGLSPREYFQLLLAHHCDADARRVLAHWLPKRRALWWASMCTWEALRPAPEPIDREIFATLDTFLRGPSDELRRTLFQLCRKANPRGPTAHLALAAYMSGGSLRIPNLKGKVQPWHHLGIKMPSMPAIPPKPFMTGRLVGVTVYLASIQRNPRNFRQVLREYLLLGKSIANGAMLWTDPTPDLDPIKGDLCPNPEPASCSHSSAPC